MDCDCCRNGGPRNPEAMRAFAGEWRIRREPIPRRDEIVAHVVRHVGPLAGVLPMPDPGPAPFDVLVVEPAPDRPFIALVTAGVSAVAMTPPPSAPPRCRRVEFAVLLPPDWGIAHADRPDEHHLWPLELLFELAWIVQEGGCWVWRRHTLEFRDGALAPGAPYPTLLLHHSAVLGRGFSELDLPDGEQIHFLSLWPLHRSECEFACRRGSDRLMERLIARGVTDVLDVGRPPVTRSRESP